MLLTVGKAPMLELLSVGRCALAVFRTGAALSTWGTDDDDDSAPVSAQHSTYSIRSVYFIKVTTYLAKQNKTYLHTHTHRNKQNNHIN